MSDIMSSAGRAANGGARAQGPIPVQQTSSQSVSRAAVIPPTEIMRRREERAKAQQERAQASSAPQGQTLQAEWEGYDTGPAGATASPPSAQPRVSQPVPPAGATQHRRTQSSQVPTTRAPVQQSTSATYPPAGSQSSQMPSYQQPAAVQQSPAANLPPLSQQSTAVPPSNTRSRANTARQPKSTQAQAGSSSGASRPQQAPPAQRVSQNTPAAAASQSRPPREAPEVQAEPQRLAQEAGMSAGTSAQAQGRRGTGSVSSFPHAFERWEMLSSKWEGMTSHWISRLHMNSEELQNQPMLAQLSRQVTDLSAAGANLFTALVELQKLRASSERKFQRWFHDTRSEMERQQELVGDLERALIQERRERAEDQVNWEKLVDNARRTEMNFSRHNAEKDRELQIAKDESRRAWEELGRYEALERERQKALAQGLPVEIGGYTVYPRLFPESRRDSVSQPPSRTDPRPTSRRGPQATQSVQDDPFVADIGAGDVVGGQHPEYRAPGSQAYTSANYATTDGGYKSFTTAPEGGVVQSPGGRFYSQENTHLGGNQSEDDLMYERDEHGNILTDEYGRPLSYRRGLHEARSSESEGENAPYTNFGPSDTADTRRRPPATTAQQVIGTSAPAGPSMQTRPEADFGFFNEEEEDDPDSRYTGAGYGVPEQEEAGTHYHPTRLSDVPEEDEASRASEAGASRSGPGIVNVTGAPF